MRKNCFYLFCLLLFFGCSKEQIDQSISTPNPKEPMPSADIQVLVENELKQNDQFSWDRVDDHVLWSALVNSDSILSIGYAPQDAGDISDRIHLINVNSPEWKAAYDKVLQEIASALSQDRSEPVQPEDVDLRKHRILPYFMIKTHSLAVVERLRQLEEIRYVDASGFSMETDRVTPRSGSGCNSSPNTNIPTADYSTIPTNGIVPWNYQNANIQQAWTTSKGSGVTIGLIDTGVSPNQNNLNDQFAVGQSTNRTIEKYGTYVTGWWWWASIDGPDDRCGHGTSMAGLIAAPLGTPALSTVGVAYKANLISYRGTSDVIVNTSREKQGVTDALVALGNRSDLKIISMSIGDLFSSGQVADAVRYAYGRGKLIFAAAGTSTGITNWVGVIFPANMSETVAVTGVEENTFPLEECNICHYGSAVDFALIMQRQNNGDRTSLTLTMDYNSPTNWPQYIGGSSCATAMTAGIAALVWSTDLSQNRAQVLDRLKQAASFYPARDSDFGWGLIDANAAVN